MPFTDVKIFTSTMAKQREALGDTITQWIRQHPEIEIVDKMVRQSSDSKFHCLTVVLFYREKAAPTPDPARS